MRDGVDEWFATQAPSRGLSQPLHRSQFEITSRHAQMQVEGPKQYGGTEKLGSARQHLHHIPTRALARADGVRNALYEPCIGAFICKKNMLIHYETELIPINMLCHIEFCEGRCLHAWTTLCMWPR